MVILPSATGLPADNVVNTFHFHAPTITTEVLADLGNRLAAFYNDNHNGSNPICSIISNSIDRSKQVKVKAYDLSDPIQRNAEGKVIAGRPPHETSFTLGASLGQGVIPNEVAVCLSYWADRNIPRQRGRLFFGPLDRSVLSTSTGDVRFGITSRELLCNAGLYLQFNNALGVDWGVWSEASQQLHYPILGGWCDDAFDTQRRRGVKPLTRSTF